MSISIKEGNARLSNRDRNMERRCKADRKEIETLWAVMVALTIICRLFGWV